MSLSSIARRDNVMVALLIAGGFITVLNQLVMAPALPSVMRDFGITAGTGQWLTSIFLMVNGLMIPVTAYLIDRFSTRQLFFAAMTAFIAGSTVAALASNFPMLLSARVFQAVGAGIQIPFGSVALMQIFPRERRGFALGLAGIVMGVAPAFGPVAAGWVIDEFGWRYIFGGITPLAVLLLLMAVIFLRNLGERGNTVIDWLSVGFSTIGFGSLLYGFSSAGNVGWLHPSTYVSIILGACAIVLFVRRQLRLDEPLLDLRLLSNPVLSIATILSMIVSAGLLVGAVLFPILLQSVMGNSATYAGLFVLPGSLLMALLSPISGMLFDRFGPRVISITGLGIVASGSLMLSFITADTSELFILFACTFRLGGIALINMPLSTWGLNALPNEKIAHGNAIINTARQVAGSIGTAVVITVMMLVTQHFEAKGAELSAIIGLDAAFMSATLIAMCALVIAVFKVKPKV